MTGDWLIFPNDADWVSLTRISGATFPANSFKFGRETAIWQTKIRGEEGIRPFV
jgi:hypothetical protein